MNFYDEAIATFHDMHPEYDTANGGTHLLHDKVLNALKRAKRVEELMLIYKQYYNGYLSPADQKRRQDLEKELGETSPCTEITEVWLEREV